MQIRDFRAADRDTFIQLCNMFYSSPAVLHSVEEQNFHATFDAILQRNPALEGKLILQEEEIAGYALMSYHWSNEAGGYIVWLEELFLHPDFRGAKLGSRFLEWFLDYYRKEKGVRLEVTAENAGAIRLYERYGFTPLPYGQMQKLFV